MVVAKEILEEIEKEKILILKNLVLHPMVKHKIDLIKPSLIIMVAAVVDFRDKTTMDLNHHMVVVNKMVVIDQMVCNLKDLVVNNNNKTDLYLKLKRTIMMNVMLLKIEVIVMLKLSVTNIKLQLLAKHQFQILS